MAGVNNVNTIVPLTTSVKAGTYCQEHVNIMSAETGRHYEETNSVGIDAARAVARAFEKALKKLASD